MAYLDELQAQIAAQIKQPVNFDVGLPKGNAYAGYYPSYEVTSPQYISPSPYSLAQLGYRTNEVIYAIISKRAKAIASAPLWVWDDRGEQPEEIKDHAFRLLLKRGPNFGISEKMFWMITEIYMCIAGFAAWEIESNNFGEPMRLWPMRPDWCSFMRGPDESGQQRPLRAIRYQPYGMPPQDVPIERVIISGYFDPLFPLIKFYSPTMNALKQINVDNSATDFLNDFMKHGAKFSGLISVASTIKQTQADDIKRRFIEAHGGTQNWTDPLVLGLGSKYETMQMNFRDMMFPELDARTESRICESFEISPITISAKVGLDRSTYSNYEQANKAWYNEWVTPEWQHLGDAYSEQALPHYHTDVQNYYCEFNLDHVKALSEDRSEKWKRADLGFRATIAKRNEAREEIGLDPIKGPEGEAFYVMTRVTSKEELTAEGEIIQGTDTTPGAEVKPADKRPVDQNADQKPTTLVEANRQAEKDAAAAEMKQFKAFAKKRIVEGKADDIPEFEFKYIDPAKQRELIRAAMTTPVLSKLEEVLKT